MDISAITPQLYVGSQPKAAWAEDIAALNIGLIISMRIESRPHPVFNEAPLKTLWLRTFDNFIMPIPMRVLVEGVEAALPVLEDGRGVLVHCAAGRHRSVAMAAAILIAQGMSAQEAMQLLSDRRQIASPYTWYIRRRIERFESYWKEKVLTKSPDRA